MTKLVQHTSGARATGSTGVGVVGLGFMGRTHVRAYNSAREAGHPNRLVAVCGADPGRFAGGEFKKGKMEGEDEGPLFDPKTTSLHSDAAELFSNDAIELVSICTYTESHVDLAIQALAAGKHVLVEKPVALRSSEVERLANAARDSERMCMPAMCMRFWPGWDWLKDAIDRGTYGRVRSAVFRRLGTHPAWSPEFYLDRDRSGGALFDLHVHDADLVRWLFGAPVSVSSTGTVEHLSTAYRFDDGPLHVIAEGGWDHSAGFPFHMGYTVVFDDATAEFALGRDRELVLTHGGETHPVETRGGTGYDGEIRHALDVVFGTVELVATLDQAVALTQMLEAERESLVSGAPVAL